jgi:hypothetical protein
MDILAPVIEEYPVLYVDCMEDTNHVEGFSPTCFLEFVMDYEEHSKQWLLKV